VLEARKTGIVNTFTSNNMGKRAFVVFVYQWIKQVIVTILVMVGRENILRSLAATEKTRQS
jgi:hypothetical protein